MKKTAILLLSAAVLPLFALEVLEARFGADKRWADVTEQFKKLKRNDDLYCGYIDGNRMAGKDPAPSVSKNMIVKYRDNDGTLRTAAFKERVIGGITAGVVPSEEFRLARAWFGWGGNYADVTPAIEKAVKSGREITLDFPSLGMNGKPDPAPGKKKEILIFYSIDNEPRCAVFFERDKFKSSMIDGSPNPIPLAGEVRSPFKGMALDTAVWQWSAPVKSVVSTENGEHPVAYLYVPPETKKIRGAVVGQFNMLEQPILEHSKFRDAMQKLDYACIWIAPSLFGANFDFKKTDRSSAMQEVFDTLAKVSGYQELAGIPFIGIGHSAMANFPWELAAWKPERAIAGISYDGTFASQAGTFNADDLKKLRGIPMLTRNGEYSWAARNENGVKLRNQHPELAVSMVCDPGAGHFDIHDAIVDYLAYFIAKADKARNCADGKLKPVDASSGWLVDRWRGDRGPSVPAAPFADFKGKEAIWVFDREHAGKLEQYQARFRGKKVQLLAYEQDGGILPDRRTHAQIHPRFRPEKDGLSFRLKGTFLDRVPAGRAEGWTGKKAGTPVGHGSDPEKIRISPICGPVVRTGSGTMAVRFNRFGFTSSRRTGEIYMLAEHPGDGNFRRSVLQSVMMIPHRNGKGIPQRITFPQIPDQKTGAESVRLGAVSSTGLPVEYFVVHGPAYIRDGELIFTKIPAGAKFPVEVAVTAYQYGTVNKPQVQSARPVTRTFQIVK